MVMQEMIWLFDQLCQPNKYKFNMDNAKLKFTLLTQLIQT